MARVGDRLFYELMHLPTEKVEQVQKIKNAIIETGLANAILLYGSYARGEWKEFQGIRSGKRSDYDIFVVTKDERDREDLENKAEKMFKNFPVVVQVMVETQAYVNQQLREKQYFYTEIKFQGILLYSDNNFEFASPVDLPPLHLKTIAERDFKHWFGTAKENFKHYGYAKNDFGTSEENLAEKKAAFEIEQCVEHCYTTVEMVFSRMNIHDHRLSILRQQAKRFAPEVDTCFPIDTLEGRGLFRHLDAAYIAGRYPDVENYIVKDEHLNYWEAEAIKLMEITERVCREKIDSIM